MILNKRQKINFGIIAIFIVTIFVITVTGVYKNNFCFNLLIILVVNVLIIILFELWQMMRLFLNGNEKSVILFISAFFRNNGYENNEILEFIRPYFKAYNEKHIKEQINKSKSTKYLNFYFFWNTYPNKRYILFLILEILHIWKIKKRFSTLDLMKISKKLTYNSETFRQIENYFKPLNDSSKNIINYELWHAYKTFGILPENNNFVLKKALENMRCAQGKSDLKKMLNIINEQNRIVSDFYRYTEDISFG